MIVARVESGARQPPRTARAAPGFELPCSQATAPGRPPAAVAATALDAMLALQEQEADAVRDREARKHGKSLLQALAALQHALLGGGDETACLHRLAGLAQTGATAADPALASAVAALALRARVELARRGM